MKTITVLFISITSLSAILLLVSAAPTDNNDNPVDAITLPNAADTTALIDQVTPAPIPTGSKFISYFGRSKQKIGNWWGYARNLLHESKANVVSARKRFRLPKVFDFAKFKAIFKKTYRSLAEEIMRQKLFLARAFRSVISAIKYRHKMLSYYLRINQMSDWTPEEQESIRMHLGGKKRPKAGPLALASEEEIVRELARVQEHAQEPGFSTIFKDISPALTGGSDSGVKTSQSSGERKRRSVVQGNHSSREYLSFQELITPHEKSREEPPEIRAKIRGNVLRNGKKPAKTRSAPANDNNHIDSAINQSLQPRLRSSDGPQPRKVVGDEYSDGKYEHDLREHTGVSGNFGETLSGLASQMAGKLIAKSKSSYGDDDDDGQGDKVFVDHRESNCFFLPRDQGDCGCCYAFAFTAYVEFLHCKETEALVPFSEQYMVDCGPRGKLSGCNGAPLAWAGKFILNFGIELRTNYPFRERQDQCPYEPDTDPRAMGNLRVGAQDLIAIPTTLESLARHIVDAPIPIGIATDGTDFTEYGGGVHDPPNCPEKTDHAVLLVGHGREDGKEYWLIRNSHSLAFGEQGYYKLAKLANCISGDGYVFGNGVEETGILWPEENPKNDLELVKRHYMRNLASDLGQI